MTNNFTITDKAKKKIENLLEKENINKFFRIEVKGGGCSGYKYNYTTDMKVNEDDLVFE
ncbi:MAG: HesB/IscA family protein, partial [Candidatus Fonsibacter sp.]